MAKIGTVISLDGEQQYINGLKSCKESVKGLNGELKDLQADNKGAANSFDFLTAKEEALTKQSEALKRQLDAAKDGLRNAKSAYQEQRSALDKLTDTYEDAKKALEDYRKSGNKSEDTLKDLEKNADDAKKAMDKQQASFFTAEKRVTSWEGEVRKAQRALNNCDSELNKNEKYLKEAASAADKCATSIDKYGDEVKDTSNDLDQANGKTQSFTDILKGFVGGTAIVEGIKMVGEAAKEAAEYVFEVGSKFEASMSNVEALSGASQTELDALSDKAKELGSSTKFSASEVADSFSYMALAGWDAQQMLDGIEAVTYMAAAANMDLAESSDLLTDYLSAFGMEASQAIEVADMLAYAQANSNTTVTQLGDAFSNCAANMHASGQSMQDTVAILEAMANQSDKGSQAGTKLSAVMRDMSSKMAEGAIQIGNTSVAVADADGNYRSIIDIMGDVEAATSNLSETERTTALSRTFSARSIQAVNEILNEGVSSIRDYATELDNSQGAAADMSATMQDNLQGALTEAKSALEGLGIAAYDKVKGPVTTAVRFATQAIGRLTKAIEGTETESDQLIKDVEASTRNVKKALENATDIQTNADEEAARIDVLTRQLVTLNAVENKSESQKLRLRGVIEELSSAIPELSRYYDEQSGSLDITKERLEALTGAYKDQLKEQALITAQQELYNAAAQAEVDLSLAQARLDNLEKTGDVYTTLIEKAGELQQQQDSDAGINPDQLKAGYNDILKVVDDAYYNALLTKEQYDAITNGMSEDEALWFQSFSDMVGRMAGELNLTDAAAEVEGLGKVLDEANAQIEALDGTQREFAESTEDITKKGIVPMEEATEETTVATFNLADATGKAKEEAEDLSEATGKVKDETEGLSDAAESAANATENLTDEEGENTKAEEEAALVAETLKQKREEEAKAAEEAAKAYAAAKDAIVDSLHKIHDEAYKSLNFDFTQEAFNGGVEATIEQLEANAQAQIDGLAKYNDNLQKVSEHLGREVSPQFLKYLEGMGTQGANILASIADEFDKDGGPERVKALSDRYMEALDMTDSAAATIAADSIAIKAALGELKESTEEEYRDLFNAITGAADNGSWGGLTEKLEASLTEAAETARVIGAKIPEKLQEGISSGDISPDEALQQLSAAIQGHMEGLAEEAASQGAQIPDEIATSISSGQDAVIASYNELISSLSGSTAEAEQAAAEAGEAQVSEFSSTVEGGKDTATSAGETLKSAAAEALQETDDFKTAGESAGSSYAEGISSKSGETSQAAKALIDAAKTALSGESGNFVSVGSQIDAGVASGINSGASSVINAAVNVARTALNAMKAALGIKSPSRVFRDEVGAQISAGVAFGIQDKEVLAVNASKELSESVVKASTQWLNAYKESRQVSLSEEEYFWREVLKHVKSGTAAYTEALAKMNAARAGVISEASGLSAADSEQIAANFGVLDYDVETVSKKIKNKKTGKTETKKVQKKVKKEAEEYYSDILSAAQKYYSNQDVLRERSAEEELAYWTQVRTHIAGGTQAWYDATKKINEAASDVEDEQIKAAEAAAQAVEDYYDSIVDEGTKYIRQQKILNDISEEDQLKYWQQQQKYLAEYSDQWFDVAETIKSLQESITEKNLAEIEKRQQAEEEAAAQAIADRLSDEQRYIDMLQAYGLKNAEGRLEYVEAYAAGITKLNNKSIATYWQFMKDTFNSGSDEQREAYEAYRVAAEAYYQEMLDLDTKYQEDLKAVNDKVRDDIQAVADTYENAVQSTKEAILSQMNLFDEWDSEGYTGDKLLANLQSQVEGLAAWQEDLHALTERGILSDELIKYLDSLGPDAAANIYSLKQMTDAELEEYQRLYDLRNQLSQEAAQRSNIDLYTQSVLDVDKLKQTAQQDVQAIKDAYDEAWKKADFNIFSKDMLTELKQGIHEYAAATFMELNWDDIGSDIYEALWNQNRWHGGLGDKFAYNVGNISNMYKPGEYIDELMENYDIDRFASIYLTKIQDQIDGVRQEAEVIGLEGLDAILAGLTDEEKIAEAAQNLVTTFKEELLLAQLEAGLEYDSALTRLNSLNVGSFGLINQAMAQAMTGPVLTVNNDYEGLTTTLAALIQTLAGTIQGMQVVMDTGALVGQISAPLSGVYAENIIRETGGRL